MNILSVTFILAALSITVALGTNIRVNSLNQLNDAISESGNTITLAPGEYDLSDLKGAKKLNFSGSNNKISLRKTYIKATVGVTDESYIEILGNDNLIVGGEFEDVYESGLTKITDFSKYNKDQRKHAYGLRGAAVMKVSGTNNTVKDTKLTVRGSWPYGYGSYYGIGAHNTFGLNKRCGILIKNINNTIDGAEVQMRAFGHGIYMQDKADKTVIKNCLVEGTIRKCSDLYEETDPADLPKRTNYRFPNLKDFKMDSPGSYPIPKDEVFSLSEDGIRMYAIPGSVTVENCTVRKMRGGIRLYLGGPAVVKDCTVQFCQYTAYNLPKGGEIIDSSGDFSFAPIADYRLGRSSTKAEWTILPSKFAAGKHNLLDLQGHNHHITLKQGKGIHTKAETRAIVITGSGSTIINKTEYAVVLAKSSKDNKVQSFGPVTDEGSNNKVRKLHSRR